MSADAKTPTPAEESKQGVPDSQTKTLWWQGLRPPTRQMVFHDVDPVNWPETQRWTDKVGDGGDGKP